MTVPKGTEMITIPPERRTAQMRNRATATEEGLRLLNPRGEEEDETIGRFKRNPRLQYAAMAAHKERASMALAVGATQKMAANYAGVSQRQIKKYYQDPDFRTRIAEHRELLTGKIQGKILKEFNRRVTGTAIRSMETMDLTRIFDRVTQGGKGMALQINGDVNIGNRYEAIVAELFASDAQTEGGDFPVYEPGGFSVSGGDSPE